MTDGGDGGANAPFRGNAQPSYPQPKTSYLRGMVSERSCVHGVEDPRLVVGLHDGRGVTSVAVSTCVVTRYSLRSEN